MKVFILFCINHTIIHIIQYGSMYKILCFCFVCFSCKYAHKNKISLIIKINLNKTFFRNFLHFFSRFYLQKRKSRYLAIYQAEFSEKISLNWRSVMKCLALLIQVVTKFMFRIPFLYRKIFLLNEYQGTQVNNKIRFTITSV